MPHDPGVGQTHPKGRQDACQRMDHYLGHAERIGDQAGVLAAGAAEAGEHVAADIVASGDRHLLNGVGHVVDGDGKKSLSDRGHVQTLAGGRRDLIGEFVELPADDVQVEALVAVGAEHGRKVGGL
jgi:hypothetical protein